MTFSSIFIAAHTASFSNKDTWMRLNKFSPSHPGFRSALPGAIDIKPFQGIYATI